jgi:hypothetical protein
VFVDTRGNYHMLVNALPGGCSPKVQQGGHAWSRDGITWSEPRVGAYNGTVQVGEKRREMGRYRVQYDYSAVGVL